MLRSPQFLSEHKLNQINSSLPMYYTDDGNVILHYLTCLDCIVLINCRKVDLLNYNVII